MMALRHLLKQMCINITDENKKKFRTSYNVKINVLIRHRYLPLVIAQLINLANSARKQISVFLDLYSTRELIASERLNFLLTQQYISLAWNVGNWLLECSACVLSYCTAIQGVLLERSFYIPFIYVSLLVVVYCVTLVNLGLAFVHFHKMFRSS
jgi:hypothetical protein